MQKNALGILVLSVLTSLLLNCQSKAEISQKELVQNLGLAEKTLDTYPYLEDSNITAYIKDKELIKKFAFNYGINTNLFINKLDSVRVSITENHQLFTVVMKDFDVVQKIKFMSLIKAGSSELFYIYETRDQENNTMYMNLIYRNTIMISNFFPENIEASLAGELPDILVKNETQEISGWFWFRENILHELLTQIDIDGVAVVVKKYIPSDEAELSYIVKTPNDKSSRTTLKLLLPLFVKSFENEHTVGLPQPYFEDEYLIVDNVFVSEETINNLLH